MNFLCPFIILSKKEPAENTVSSFYAGEPTLFPDIRRNGAPDAEKRKKGRPQPALLIRFISQSPASCGYVTLHGQADICRPNKRHNVESQQPVKGRNPILRPDIVKATIEYLSLGISANVQRIRHHI